MCQHQAMLSRSTNDVSHVSATNYAFRELIMRLHVERKDQCATATAVKICLSTALIKMAANASKWERLPLVEVFVDVHIYPGKQVAKSSSMLERANNRTA